MPNYCVHVTSRRNRQYYDIMAESADEASICAVQDFFCDFPNSQDVRVMDVELFEGQGQVGDCDYNPYHSSEASLDSSYTSYSSHQQNSQSDAEQTGYIPYSSSLSSTGNAAAMAGFTTDLPAPPVLETSYHKPLPNGYAPYRSFRVILPR